MTPASVIVVTFNSAETIRQGLESLPASVEVIVVDQCSTDDSVSVIKASFPNVNVIAAGQNRGFGAGCNLGAANATREILVFLNPDTVVSSGSIEQLADDALGEPVLVGPRIRGSDGTDETRARFPSNLASDLGEIFLPVAVTDRVFRRDIPRTSDVYRLGGEVGYVQGAYMVLHRKHFEKIGGFDERLFLYHEEESLARRLRSMCGVSTILDPRAEIVHVGAKSTSQVHLFAVGQYYRSLVVEYGARMSRWAAVCCGLVIVMALCCMRVLTPVRMAIGMRADRGSDWYRAAVRGAASGLVGSPVSAP